MSLTWESVDSLLTALAGIATTGLIHGTVLAAVTAILCATVLRRARPALLAALWTIVLCKFLVPLGPELPMSLSGLLDTLLYGASAATTSADAAPVAMPAAAGAGSLADALWLAATLCLWLAYGVVVTWLLVRRLRAHRRLARAAAAYPVASPALTARVAEAARQVGLARLPAVRVSEHASSPQVVGVWRPTLIVPRWLWAEQPRAALDAALLHELAHLCRFDTWLRALQLLVATLFWFWPVVYWVNRRIDTYREMACDQWAIASGPLSAGAYARMLVTFARRASTPSEPAAAISLLGARAQIEHRVVALLAGSKRPRMGWITGVVVGLWALVSLGSTSRATAASPVDECELTPAMVAELLVRFPEVDLDGDGVVTREEVCAQRERIERVLSSESAWVATEASPVSAGPTSASDALTNADELTAADGNVASASPVVTEAAMTDLKQRWQAVGWSECAACGCSADPDPDSMSARVLGESKLCTNEE